MEERHPAGPPPGRASRLVVPVKPLQLWAVTVTAACWLVGCRVGVMLRFPSDALGDRSGHVVPAGRRAAAVLSSPWSVNAEFNQPVDSHGCQPTNGEDYTLLTFPLLKRLFLEAGGGRHAADSSTQQSSKNRPLWTCGPASAAKAVARVHVTRPA